jgi:hypothetical protein
MKFAKTCAAICMALGLLAVEAPAQAAFVEWSVDSAASYIRLNIPDQQSVLDGTSATIRVRGQDNSTWSDATGKRAFLDGSIATNVVGGGSSLSFLSGQHNLFALESGSFRPNPVAFDANATDVDNPDGSYTDTSGAPAAYAGKFRPVVLSLINLDLGYFTFRDVSFDIQSGPLALDDGGAFSGTSSFGIDSAVLDIDGLSAAIVGQPIPDILSEPMSGLAGASTLSGAITTLGDLLPVLTLNINTPLLIDVNGVTLNASLTGQIVAYAAVPEPSSVLLAGSAALGLVVVGVRRRRRPTPGDERS